MLPAKILLPLRDEISIDWQSWAEGRNAASKLRNGHPNIMVLNMLKGFQANVT